MNDSLPGNSDDADGDFDLSGFLDDSDFAKDSAPKPKAATPSPAAKFIPKSGKQGGEKPVAKISKGHREIKSAPPEVKSRYSDRDEGRPIRSNDRGEGRPNRSQDRGERSNRPSERGDRPNGRFDNPASGGYAQKPYPARQPGYNRDSGSRGSNNSIHHIPPRVIERVGGVIHKPVSLEVKPFLPLKTDKGRWKESRFLLEGSKNISDVLAAGTGIVATVLYSEEFADLELLSVCKKNRIEMIKVTADDISALSDTESPQGIIAVANFATLKPDWSLARYVTLLDGVQDPGNVGAILRTSLALGMDAVVVGKGSCDPYNPKVVRSSVGALMRLPFETGEDLGAKMEFLRLKGFSIVATSSHARLTLDQAKLRKKVALIVGNEGAGTGAQYQDMADTVVKIPLKNKVESLNVSVAHGILTYQLIHGRS